MLRVDTARPARDREEGPDPARAADPRRRRGRSKRSRILQEPVRVPETGRAIAQHATCRYSPTVRSTAPPVPLHGVPAIFGRWPFVGITLVSRSALTTIASRFARKPCQTIEKGGARKHRAIVGCVGWIADLTKQTSGRCSGERSQKRASRTVPYGAGIGGDSAQARNKEFRFD